MLTLSRQGPLPLYHQLKTVILREIEAGRWEPDAQLPTEDELARRFGVSKITVRQALRDLAVEGFIRREQGRGTFVERRRLQQGPRELTSFTGERRGHGLVPASKVLEQATVPAAPEVATALAIEAGAPVFRLRRLRLADRQPMGIQTAYLPSHLVPGTAARVGSRNVLRALDAPGRGRSAKCAGAIACDDRRAHHAPVGRTTIRVRAVSHARRSLQDRRRSDQPSGPLIARP